MIKRAFFEWSVNNLKPEQAKFIRENGGFDKLTWLQINGAEDKFLLDNIEFFKSVDTIRLTNFSDEQLKMVPPVRIKAIILYNCGQLSSLETLPQFDSLQYLRISYNDRLRNLKGIERFCGLQTVELVKNYRLSNLDNLARLKRLKRLSIVQDTLTTDLAILD
ncbi:MAG: hypothetical protein EBZ77_10840, partial [Chitinophagia bacterium]|nr:hypothetical protein [Chitinophagia bacterium]